MNVRLRVFRIPLLAIAAVAAVVVPAAAQTARTRPEIVSDAPLVPIVGAAKEELLRTVLAHKSGGLQSMSPAHHDCTNNQAHVQGIGCPSTTNDQLTNPGSCQLSDGSWVDFYSFSGTAGQQVTIDLSSTWDNYLFLLNPAQDVASEDDDSGGGTNARIVLTLTSTGTWYIAVNSFAANVFGAYTLTISCTGGGGGACVSNATTLCLNNSRFRVTVTFLTPQGQSGSGMAVPETIDTGMFWFFSSNNIEAIIKVVNGCVLNSRYWVFAGGLTNVQVVLTVTDTQNGTVRTYTNPQGTAFAPIQDTAAFATCP
ncbi:MAG TPA: PPC domain-containing protein [Thermoanaerobaculia bacterium]|nr:PPC domain-containing protein [Thermoanaerobaculia bacterium]